MTEEEIREALENMKELKIVPWEEQNNNMILERGKRLYSEYSGEERERIKQAIITFEKVLQSKIPTNIKKVAEEITQYFDSLETDW